MLTGLPGSPENHQDLGSTPTPIDAAASRHQPHPDPRNGRNFEYLSEDPLLSAALGAEPINGIQGEGVISTIKHYSLDWSETNRHWLDAVIVSALHPEADLFAFPDRDRADPGWKWRWSSGT